MTISRRRFLESSAELGAVSLLATAPALAADDALRFFVIGDWGRDGAFHQRAVGRAMAAAAAQSNPRFIVSAGDNFYESGVSSVKDVQWTTSFEDIYNEAPLQRPWHTILGNHDYRGNVQAQIDYAKISHRWHMPSRYYSRVEPMAGGDAELFFIDTSPFIRKYIGTKTNITGQDTQVQRAWLDAALARSTARCKIVIGHHPLYTTIGGHWHDQPDMIAAIEPVLRHHKVPLYINGHDHTMQYVELGGIGYATTGAGSETYYYDGTPSRTGFLSTDHGFLVVTVTAGRIDLDFIDMTGRRLFAKTLNI